MGCISWKKPPSFPVFFRLGHPALLFLPPALSLLPKWPSLMGKPQWTLGAGALPAWLMQHMGGMPWMCPSVRNSPPVFHQCAVPPTALLTPGEGSLRKNILSFFFFFCSFIYLHSRLRWLYKLAVIYKVSLFLPSRRRQPQCPRPQFDTDQPEPRCWPWVNLQMGVSVISKKGWMATSFFWG